MLNSLKSLNRLYQEHPSKIIFEEDGMPIHIKEFAEYCMTYIEHHAVHQMNIEPRY